MKSFRFDIDKFTGKIAGIKTIQENKSMCLYDAFKANSGQVWAYEIDDKRRLIKIYVNQWSSLNTPILLGDLKEELPMLATYKFVLIGGSKAVFMAAAALAKELSQHMHIITFGRATNIPKLVRNSIGDFCDSVVQYVPTLHWPWRKYINKKRCGILPKTILRNYRKADVDYL